MWPVEKFGKDVMPRSDRAMGGLARIDRAT
jgi:hypothetical protein